MQNLTDKETVILNALWRQYWEMGGNDFNELKLDDVSAHYGIDDIPQLKRFLPRLEKKGFLTWRVESLTGKERVITLKEEPPQKPVGISQTTRWQLGIDQLLDGSFWCSLTWEDSQIERRFEDRFGSAYLDNLNL